jgi:hypothetical protein
LTGFADKTVLSLIHISRYFSAASESRRLFAGIGWAKVKNDKTVFNPSPSFHLIDRVSPIYAASLRRKSGSFDLVVPELLEPSRTEHDACYPFVRRRKDITIGAIKHGMSLDTAPKGLRTP